jgi:hypothetical protein
MAIAKLTALGSNQGYLAKHQAPATWLLKAVAEVYLRIYLLQVSLYNNNLGISSSNLTASLS